MPDNRKGFASALHIRGLRQRWMFSAVLPILLLLVLAVATSIDALAVGVTFSMVELSVSIGLAVALIGCTTFLISLGGVYVGNVFGARYKSRAELVGGAILILIGVKVLLEHLLG